MENQGRKLKKQRKIARREFPESPRRDSIDIHIPEDIIFDILSNYLVPKHELFKFRCVCKAWNSFISALFLQPELSNGSLLILQGDQKNITHMSSFDEGIVNKDLIVMENVLDGDNCNDVDSCNVYSINGLICILSSDDIIRVCNPTIGKYMTLPKYDYQEGRYAHLQMGFGFHESTKEYKVVMMVSDDDACVGCAVFTLGNTSNSWRTISNPNYPNYSIRLNGIYVNGWLYWMAHTDMYKWVKIVSFDVGEEQFGQLIPTPAELDCEFYGITSTPLSLSLMKLRGCLCLAHCIYANEFVNELQIWMLMEEDSANHHAHQAVWVKKYKINFQGITGLDCYSILIISADDEKIVLKLEPEFEDSSLIYCDFRSQKLETVYTDCSHFHAIPYTFSLCWYD